MDSLSLSAQFPLFLQPDEGKSVFFMSWIIPMIVLFFLGKYFFCQFMASISLRKIFKSMEPRHEEDFVKSLYFTLCIIMSVSIGEYSTRSEIWRSEFEHCFIGFDQHVHSWSLKFYYTFSLAFYSYSGISLAFFEVKKKDHFAMCLHHVITCTTIFLSGLANFPRIGAVILLLFDVCDIFLESAKLFIKAKEEVPATFFFVIFAALWGYNRLYIFPTYVIPVTIKADVLSRSVIPYHMLHITIMVTLFVLNVYWSYFIVKKLVGLKKNGCKKECDDPREQVQSS